MWSIIKKCRRILSDKQNMYIKDMLLFSSKMSLLEDVGKKMGSIGILSSNEQVASKFKKQPINEESYEIKR